METILHKSYSVSRFTFTSSSAMGFPPDGYMIDVVGESLPIKLRLGFNGIAGPVLSEEIAVRCARDSVEKDVTPLSDIEAVSCFFLSMVHSTDSTMP